MPCPFLKESEVRFCEAAPARKMIPQIAGAAGTERCSSSDHARCPLVHERPGAPAGSECCPYLRNSLVQYCAAASVTRFIPYSSALQSCCLTEGHRYCDVYVSWAEPGRSAARKEAGRRPIGTEGIEVPPHLSFSANHMWIDTRGDGTWHLGLDAFFAKVAGEVERVAFVTTRYLCHPAAVLTVGGVDLQMVFPERLFLTGVNVSLKSDPAKIVEDPYVRGWLFEGTRPPGELILSRPNRRARRTRLARGVEALEWMRRESERVERYARERLSRPSAREEILMNDGGVFSGRVARHMEREDLLRLFNEFFPPEAEWRAT